MTFFYRFKMADLCRVCKKPVHRDYVVYCGPECQRYEELLRKNKKLAVKNGKAQKALKELQEYLVDNAAAQYIIAKAMEE